MKQLYLKCLLLCILFLTGVRAYAYDCYVDGIYYNLNESENTASVTFLYNSSSNSSAYQGSITIPSSIFYKEKEYKVTSIGPGAFQYCTYLTSIEIPISVESIEDDAFNICSGLTSIDIPSRVTKIGYGVFSSCIGLTTINIPNSVTSIGQNAFSGCSSLTSIIIPSDVSTIESGVFQGCCGLESITIGKSVTYIGVNTFSDCSNLRTLIIEDGPETLSIGTYFSTTFTYSNTFDRCLLTTLYLGRNINYYPSGYISSPSSPFWRLTTLTSVTFGDNVTSIGNNMFSDCSNLTSVTIGNGVTNIGSSAFSGCSNLKSITIPNSVKTIGEGAFSDCNNLTSPITIPNGVTCIEGYTFSGCNGLTSVTIGNSVASIGDYAFSGCCSLTLIDLPNRVTNIGGYAFEGCSGLTSINIPNRVTFIGENAFQNCDNLTSLSIPISVTSIGNSAFYGCTNLESVYSEITDVFSIGAFGNGSENATLYVPYGTKLKYIQTSGWNVFNDIVEMDPAIMNTSLLLSCNSKGSITINGTTVFTNKIGSVDILEDAENTLVFTPKANCKLEQVCFNGFDITTSVENNTLKAVIPAKSQMVVMFSKQGDLNNDGNIDISDVVSLVNMILGQ